MRNNPEPEENIIIYIIPCPDCNGDGCAKCNFEGKIEVREGNPVTYDADVIDPLALKNSLEKIDSGYKFKINIDNFEKAGFKREELRTPKGFIESIKNKISKKNPTFDEVIDELDKMGFLHEYSGKYQCPKCGKEIDVTNLCLKPGDQVMCDNCKVYLTIY